MKSAFAREADPIPEPPAWQQAILPRHRVTGAGVGCDNCFCARGKHAPGVTFRLLLALGAWYHDTHNSDYFGV